jgi:hypothetical protein
MTGDYFRNKIGAGTYQFNDDGSFVWVEDSGKDEFHKIKKKLRVLARATDEDKMLLV